MSLIDRLKRLFGGGAPESPAPGGAAADEVECDGSSSDMISCEDALRLVHEYLDGELEGVSQEEVRAHFDVCGRCYPHLELERAYRGAVRRAGTAPTAPEGLRDKVATLLAQAESEG